MISIIIPMYNAENYIEKCIRSIQNQTYLEWELIIIDDGSADDSYEICKGLSKLDNRIRVERQDNKGPSAARNHGIDLAVGEYITFVDADDYIEPEYLKYLLDLFSTYECEMSSCGWKVIDWDGNIEGYSPTFTPQVFNINSMYNASFTIPYTVWHTMYLTELIRKHNIRFDESIFFLEDLQFIFCYLQYASRVVNTSVPLYNWVSSPSSLTRGKMDEDKFKKWYTKIIAREKICEMTMMDTALIEANIDGLLYESAMMLLDIRTNNIQAQTEKKHVKDNVRKYRKRIFRKKFSFSNRRRIRLFFLCFFGIDLKRR